MPVGFSSDDVFPGILSALDEHVAPEQRVRWTMRAISVYDARRVSRLLQEAGEQKGRDDENRLLNEALRIGIVGWQNAPADAGEFGDEGLDRALSTRQKYELGRQYPVALFVAESEKKVSRWQPASAAATSAKDALAAVATTSPAPAAA